MVKNKKCLNCGMMVNGCDYQPKLQFCINCIGVLKIAYPSLNGLSEYRLVLLERLDKKPRLDFEIQQIQAFVSEQMERVKKEPSNANKEELKRLYEEIRLRKIELSTLNTDAPSISGSGGTAVTADEVVGESTKCRAKAGACEGGGQ